ncbi:helix-turn-helix transcriptional regulator [Herbidospora mongoliensis]|uniref:helix-turn-helix transcriptional regulator n=1 Tax=Herbidospora mongoliensis TaxID=688067 RepID=UPI000835BEB9|nr:helix-turn-helix transcriptional regulator [Herbidospora mongoliensis]
MDRNGLADFLRTRRARLKPRDVGLPDGVRRRTAGLRRQEVAELAGMSIDYYIRLEQARGPHPSRQVLNALARALMLTGDERAHLYHLAGELPGHGEDHPAGVSAGPSRARQASSPVKAPGQGIQDFLATLTDIPAYVLDAGFDILAANPLALHLIPYLTVGGNEMRGIFAGPVHRQVCRYADSFAAAAVRELRAATATRPQLRNLATELAAGSPLFAELWAAHDVEIRRELRKQLLHEIVGEIDVRRQILDVPDSGQRLIMYVPVPGTGAQEALRRVRELLERPGFARSG